MNRKAENIAKSLESSKVYGKILSLTLYRTPIAPGSCIIAFD